MVKHATVPGSEKIPIIGYRIPENGVTFTRAGIIPDSVTEKVLAAYNDARVKYVVSHGWNGSAKPGYRDADRYDASFDTGYFISTVIDRSQINPVLAGFRLTKIKEPQESLSVSMLDNNPPLKGRVVAQLSRFEDVTWFDLTRLVTDFKPDSSDIYSQRIDLESSEIIGNIVLELIAAAIDFSKAESDDKVKWLFLTTDGIIDFLRSLEIDVEEISRGEVTMGDNYESVFCIVTPAKALSRVRESGASEIAKRTSRVVVRTMGQIAARLKKNV